MRDTFRTDFLFFNFKNSRIPIFKSKFKLSRIRTCLFPQQQNEKVRQIIDHNSVIEETDVWLKDTDIKGKNCFDVTEMNF